MVLAQAVRLATSYQFAYSRSTHFLEQGIMTRSGTLVLASVERVERDCARMAVLVVVSRPKDDAREEQGDDALAEDLEQLTVETSKNTEAFKCTVAAAR